MGLLSGLFGGKKKKNVNAAADENDVDPWIGGKVTREKMRELVNVRVKYIGSAAEPLRMDLSNMLEGMIGNEAQRADVRRMWKEEVEAFKGTQVKMGSKKSSNSLLD